MASPPLDTPAGIEHAFTYHRPTKEQAESLELMNEAMRATANTIIATCPPGATRMLALRELQKARMFANASIVLDGGPTDGVA